MEEELIKEVWQIYEEEIAARDNQDYEINKSQMRKLIMANDFFHENVKKFGGDMAPFKIVPKEISSGVTITCTLLDITGDDIGKFCRVIESASAITINGTLDGKVCISMTIPDVFKHR